VSEHMTTDLTINELMVSKTCVFSPSEITAYHIVHSEDGLDGIPIILKALE